jgi:hypothetical protein
MFSSKPLDETPRAKTPGYVPNKDNDGGFRGKTPFVEDRLPNQQLRERTPYHRHEQEDDRPSFGVIKGRRIPFRRSDQQSDQSNSERINHEAASAQKGGRRRFTNENKDQKLFVTP